MSTQRSGHLERTAQEPRDKFSAGQWLDTYVPGHSKPGGFTITSTPRAAADPESPYFELAVQESPDNPPAAWLWKSPPEIINSKLQVRVGGSFIFPPADITLSEISRVVFVAGGVGINPLISMMGCIAEEGYDLDVRVLYASKVSTQGLKDVLFMERIRAWFEQETLKGGFKVFATGEYSGHEEIVGIDFLKRRLTIEDVSTAIEGKEGESVVYVCGPAVMTDEIVEGLTSDGGMDKKRVMLEKWW
ncbi:Oxidoreductase NAD-binding domain-containing protein 1 [Fusarium austroafricanum]|uniref:Oxidoreductase NAD-binding domain-containing protein 1 n=1 Tax=Fusarium austroafricanum TaxID=2364996 RepID=A0A8H4KMI0_9HYPO|nr:Oxidoreductase NAD-binding domain-containing protein 1 [Fusarium austroafricanum]